MTISTALALQVADFLDRTSVQLMPNERMRQGQDLSRQLRDAATATPVTELDDLATSEINHLRRLVGWIRTEVGQSPEELVATVKSIAPILNGDEITPASQQRLVEAHRRASDVPKYVRAAVKALTKVVGRASMASAAEKSKAAASAAVFDLSNSELRLMAGEMNAGEMRTARAVLIGVKARFLESVTATAATTGTLDAATLHRAIAVMRAECLNDPTDDPGDIGYDTAVQHCVEAIELLLKEPAGTDAGVHATDRDAARWREFVRDDASLKALGWSNGEGFAAKVDRTIDQRKRAA